MGRSSLLLFVVAAGVGVWILLQRYEIRGLKQLGLVRRDAGGVVDGGVPASTNDEGTIRIASFNIEAFGPAKVENDAVMEVLGRIIREFDIVAIQDVRSDRPDVLRELLDRVNETGRHYSLLVGPQVGRTSNKVQYVFVFDQVTVEADRVASYTVDDPDDLLHRPPFVGWFRTRGPDTDRAFTFTLVNVHTDRDESQYEIEALDDVFYKVRDDGRDEDDLIMLGDFNLDDKHLGKLGAITGILAAIANRPTNTRQTQQYDNLVFQLPATSEYAGHSGVFDFMREYNLTLEQALQVSDHLPVWAEFSVLEWGDQPAVVAAQGAAGLR